MIELVDFRQLEEEEIMKKRRMVCQEALLKVSHALQTSIHVVIHEQIMRCMYLRCPVSLTSTAQTDTNHTG